MTKGGKAMIGVAALTILGIIVGSFHPKAQWRARVVVQKLRGDLPRSSWLGILAHMVPSKLRSKMDVLPGFVKLEQKGTGPCPVLWRTTFGPFWGRSQDARALDEMIFDQSVLRVYQNEFVSVRPGDVVMDAGSHIGTFARDALDAGASLVVAFEPEPTNVACFKKTFEREISDQRVLLIQKALWAYPGFLQFEIADDPLGGHVAETGDLMVRATTIDETVSKLGLQSVDFIKMDIEGAERHALAGARETLARFRPRMAICTYHRPDDAAVITRAVLDAHPGYGVQTTDGQAYFFPIVGR